MTVLAVGLDGGTLDLLGPWMDAGHLPNLAAIRAAGVCGPLESVMPPVTAPAWATFMTGKLPGTHGVHDFFDPLSPDLDRPRIVQRTDVRGAAFWDYLSEAGLRVVILNVPLTYPQRALNGILVPGILGPEEGKGVTPAGALDKLAAEIGPYRLNASPCQPGRERAFLAELRHVISRQFAYATRLAGLWQPDFMMFHLFALDNMLHRLWHVIDPSHPWHRANQHRQLGVELLDLVQRMDAGIGQLAEKAGADTVLVLSDHGFGPQHSVTNLNLLLLRHGLLALKPGIGRRLRLKAWRTRTGTAAVQRLRRNRRPLGFGDVDWRRTRAYSLGHLGQVWINLVGRQPWGTVSRGEYDRALADAKMALGALSESAGPEAMSVRILESDKSSPYEPGPDLYVIVDDYRVVAYPLFAASGHVIAPERLLDSGNHRMDGMLLAAGPAVRRGVSVDNCRLVDLAPTILHLLGVPVPDDLEGRVLEQAFHEDYLTQNPVQRQAAMPPEPPGDPTAFNPGNTNDSMTARLRDLGYL